MSLTPPENTNSKKCSLLYLIRQYFLVIVLFKYIKCRILEYDTISDYLLHQYIPQRCSGSANFLAAQSLDESETDQTDVPGPKFGPVSGVSWPPVGNPGTILLENRSLQGKLLLICFI